MKGRISSYIAAAILSTAFGTWNSNAHDILGQAQVLLNVYEIETEGRISNGFVVTIEGDEVMFSSEGTGRRVKAGAKARIRGTRPTTWEGERIELQLIGISEAYGVAAFEVPTNIREKTAHLWLEGEEDIGLSQSILWFGRASDLGLWVTLPGTVAAHTLPWEEVQQGHKGLTAVGKAYKGMAGAPVVARSYADAMKGKPNHAIAIGVIRGADLERGLVYVAPIVNAWKEIKSRIPEREKRNEQR